MDFALNDVIVLRGETDWQEVRGNSDDRPQRPRTWTKRIPGRCKLNLQLVDGQGEIWDGASRKLRLAYDSPYSGGEFSEYAVVNLGFIALNVYGPSAQIRMRPSFVSDRAFDTLYRWLLTKRFDRIVLTMLQKEWSNELIGSTTAALTRLDEIIEVAKRSLPDEFLSRELEARQILGDPILSMIADTWKHRDALHLAGVPPALQPILTNRYILLRRDETSARLVFKELGDGLFAPFETWRTCAVGAPVEELPDRKYGRWAAHAYHEVIASHAPKFEHVDAIVRWPSGGPSRMRYKRFILPLADASSQQPLLLGGSFLDDRIDLRVGSLQQA